MSMPVCQVELMALQPEEVRAIKLVAYKSLLVAIKDLEECVDRKIRELNFWQNETDVDTENIRKKMNVLRNYNENSFIRVPIAFHRQEMVKQGDVKVGCLFS